MPKRGVVRFVAEYTLATFIMNEMRRRNLGVREFADLVGVTHGTIDNYVLGKSLKPSLGFLIKLSDSTGVELTTILALGYPEIAHKMMIDPELNLMARRLNDLPQDLKDFILRSVGL